MRNSLLFIIVIQSLLSCQRGLAKLNVSEVIQKTTEQQIRHLLEPILDKYCHEECKLMNVNITVDLTHSETLAPGFDDTDLKNSADLSPSSAVVKILMNDKIGPVSRRKLIELIQQYLDNLDFPIKIETQIAHFPMPQGSEGKISEMREKISKQFQNAVDDILRQFCPKQCILSDYSLQTVVINGEEAQYGSPGEYIQEGDTAIRIKDISVTLLMDQGLNPEEQLNIIEMIKLKTSSFKNVNLNKKVIKFPRPMVGENESNNRSISSVFSDNNSTIQNELKKLKIFGIIFSISILLMIIFISFFIYYLSRSRSQSNQRASSEDFGSSFAPSKTNPNDFESHKNEITKNIKTRYKIDQLQDELIAIYAQQPRVAKQVFTRLLTEEGVQTTAECIHLFGEGIVIDMLRDPSLQTDLANLLEYYAKTQIELNDEQKLELLRRLQSRTISGKLSVIGSRSSNLFDFLAEMDGPQILELIRDESLTIKAIILTQCDSQKRASMYTQMDPKTRMEILSELSRIDYLPRDFIFNVANSLKIKRRDNPKLNTEVLPGSEVLVSLLERTGPDLQRSVVKTLESSNPESARTVKGKLVSIETLKYLRDQQLLEVILSLKHDELIQFLKGTPEEIRYVIFSKCPKDLVIELEEELEHSKHQNQETYLAVERKILNRMRVMSHEGQINLVETNERMFSDSVLDPANLQSSIEKSKRGRSQVKRKS